MKKLIVYIFSLFIFISCISEYHAKGVDELKNLLVVEGMITQGVTTIKLSRSVGLDENVYEAQIVDNAVVWVESETGEVYKTGGYTGNGAYIINIDKLDYQTKYRLRITIGNEEYESSYSYPIQTPEIDRIFWKKDANIKAVDICVSTHGSLDQPRYYTWSYQEIWEIRAKLYSNFMFDDNDSIVMYDEYSGPFNMKYYCWIWNASNSFILGSAERFSENVIYEKKLIGTQSTNDRFSELYYIKVNQNMISKSAYDYFTNLQKNVESTGSIFSPVLSEMKGNLYCVTNPDIPVIGYIEVSDTKSKEIFFPRSLGIYDSSPDYHCVSLSAEEAKDRFDVEEYLLEEGIGFLYAPRACFDCTAYGTKNKPSFWPNDHK